jgi:putative DNA primase/helicase
MTMQSEITEALNHVPADVDRDTWAKVGMAIKSELGDAGFETFDQWSRTAGSYIEQDCKDTYRSVRADGGITIKSLFALAKEHGYQPPRDDHQKQKSLTLAWNSATENRADDHPYLKLKNIKAHGTRISGKTLLIPVSDLDGKVQSAQLVFLDGGKWDKKYQTGTKLKDDSCHVIGSLDSTTIVLAEGLGAAASIHEATGYTTVICFGCDRLAKVGRSIKARYPDANLLIAGDDDTHHKVKNPGREKAIKAGKEIGAKVVFPSFSSGSGTDFNDLHLREGIEAVRQQIDAGLAQDDSQPTPKASTLVCVTIADLLSRELPAIDPLLSPWLGKQSLNIVYAWRGVGKTHFALNLAYAVASGGEFLGWQAPEPNGVLYLDGEMPGGAMQSRLASIIASHPAECDPAKFRIVTPDLQSSFMPDLATQEGQDAIEEQINPDTSLIIVDNLSSLVRRGGRENDAESWLNVGEWAMFQRSRGRSVLFIHHSGKDGRQRGTSKREDILDTVVRLSRPSDYESTQGARFVVEFEKDRHNTAGQPFEAQLQGDEHGQQIWTTKLLETSRMDQIIDLAELGMSVTDISIEIGCNKSTVSRTLQKAEEKDLYTPKKKGGKGKVIDLKTRERRDVDD